MRNHKTHNRMQVATGKVALTPSQQKQLKRQQMLASGGRVREGREKIDFAKAVLMADGGVVGEETPWTQVIESEDDEIYQPPELDNDPNTGEPYVNSESFKYTQQMLAESRRRLADAAQKATEYARQANTSIGKEIDIHLLEMLNRSPSRYYEIASDPVAYKHWKELSAQAGVDDAKLESLARKLWDRDEFWSGVQQKYKTQMAGSLPGEDNVKAGKDVPKPKFSGDPRLDTPDIDYASHSIESPATGNRNLRQYTDKKNITHLTNKTTPMMPRASRPPSPDVYKLHGFARPTTQPTRKMSSGGMVNDASAKSAFARAIKGR